MIQCDQTIAAGRQVLIGFRIHVVETGLPWGGPNRDLLETESLRVLKIYFQAFETMWNRLDEQSLQFVLASRISLQGSPLTPSFVPTLTNTGSGTSPEEAWT